MRFLTKKAFTLLEFLLITILLSFLALLSLNNRQEINYNHLLFMSSYYYNQAKALSNKEDISFEYLGNIVHFNSDGNVDQARTIYFGNHKVIIHLGNGSLRYE